MAMSLALQNASFVLVNGQTLFENIHLTLKHRVSALVGANGVGKSVLAQIIAQQIPPASGNLNTNMHIAYVPQQWRGQASDKIAEVLGLSAALAAISRIEQNCAQTDDFEIAEPWWDWQSKLAQVQVDCGLPLQLDLHRNIGSFSGGEQFRLCWAAARMSGADLFVLDEPTNHLDKLGRKLLLDWITQAKQQFLVVTHDRSLLQQVDAIYELTPSQLHYHAGNYQQFIAGQKLRWQQQNSAVNETRKTEKRVAVKAQEAFEKQQQRTANGKAKAKRENWSVLERNGAKQAGEASLKKQTLMRDQRSNASQTARQQAEQSREWFEPIGLTLPQSAIAEKTKVLSLVGFSVGFENPLHQPINLNLHCAFRLHITGNNGAGKTVFIKTLRDELAAFTGSSDIHVATASLDQHFHEFINADSALKNFLRLQPSLTEKEARDRLAWLRLRNTKADVPFAALSGGEQLKVALACKLLGKHTPQLLILDEPTNHLDLDSIMALEQAIAEFKGAMIIISHDQPFVDSLKISHCLTLPKGELETFYE